MTDAENKDSIKVSSYGGRDGGISLTGFSKESLEKMLASMQAGAYYVKVDNGELTSVPIWESLPRPFPDEEMMPFWRKYSGAKQKFLFDEYQHSEEKGYSQSITIQHLCGHYYTKEGYIKNAEKLESYGFECLRSRRGNDASFWEIWFLPGLWCAKGSLADQLKKQKLSKEQELEKALRFLASNVSFGTLDVSSQRLAMANPE